MEQNQTIEKTTLSQLIHNEEFNRKVIPFLKKEYFHQRSEQILFEEINDFVVERLNSLEAKNDDFLIFAEEISKINNEVSSDLDKLESDPEPEKEQEQEQEPEQEQ